MANVENLTSFLHEPDSTDPDKVFYFHVDMVTPGKNYYCVKHDQGQIVFETTEEEEPEDKQKDPDRGFFIDLQKMKTKKKARKEAEKKRPLSMADQPQQSASKITYNAHHQLICLFGKKLCGKFLFK